MPPTFSAMFRVDHNIKHIILNVPMCSFLLRNASSYRAIRVILS